MVSFVRHSDRSREHIEVLRRPPGMPCAQSSPRSDSNHVWRDLDLRVHSYDKQGELIAMCAERTGGGRQEAEQGPTRTTGEGGEASSQARSRTQAPRAADSRCRHCDCDAAIHLLLQWLEVRQLLGRSKPRYHHDLLIGEIRFYVACTSRKFDNLAP